MKHVWLPILFILTMSCKENSGRVERELYKCLTSSMSLKEAQRLKPIIAEFESYLIKNAVLESSTARSYWNFYKKVADSGTIDFSNDFNFSEKISFLNGEDFGKSKELINCHTKIFESEYYLGSKQHLLKEEIQSLKKHSFTPKMMARTTVDILTVEDFELEYNRLITLLFIERLHQKSK